MELYQGQMNGLGRGIKESLDVDKVDDEASKKFVAVFFLEKKNMNKAMCALNRCIMGKNIFELFWGKCASCLLKHEACFYSAISLIHTLR